MTVTVLQRILFVAGMIALSARPSYSAGSDPSEALYDPDHVLNISITLDPRDWDRLRFQIPDYVNSFGFDCEGSIDGTPYDYFPADITIDGESITDAGVRKKGLYGSLSTTRPSLKISFNEYSADRSYHGIKNITLNNNRQDPSLLKQCLSYRLFADAGVPASRCNFAHVFVNGSDLGIYSNVEPVKKDFLKRNFRDGSGNLYEGTLADFRPITEWTSRLQKKTNSREDDWTDVTELIRVLELPDHELLDSLERILAIDAFITFWAMEVLIGHSDGYTTNTNNYYFYHNPVSGTFEFIPWGLDITLSPDDDDEHPSEPLSVKANSIIARRLYRLPETRGKYISTMEALLDTVWDSEALLAQLQHLEGLLRPYLPPDEQDRFSGAVGTVRRFISNRESVIRTELLEGPPDWNFPLRESSCLRLSQCFIATAAFGSPLEGRVHILREFRDSYIGTNAPGRMLLKLYCRYSPPLARYIAGRPVLRAVIRAMLVPLAAFAGLALHVGIIPLAAVMLLAGLCTGLVCVCRARQP